MDKAISKYLSNYAQKEATLPLENFLPHRRYGHVIIIPACAEGIDIIKTLRSVPKDSSPVLIIVIINARTDAEPHVHHLNQESLESIKREYGTATPVRENQAYLFSHTKGALCVIDRFSEGLRFPPREGVGLARKLGTDLALRLWINGLILSPYLHSSDADVLFPPDTFQQIRDASPNESKSAILLPFWHEPFPDQPKLRRANALYEIKLRYYVLGLASAHSPYAFHTIGSTIAIHAHDYARVRGFPKRQAAEDFYLLNKLAKVRPVARATGRDLKIKGRYSNRVPFGTGKSLIEICTNPNEDYLIYAPKTFEALKTLLRRMQVLFEKPDSIQNIVNTDEDHILRTSLEKLAFIQSMDDCLRRGATPRQRQKNFHTYFDGFRSLKLIHELRDQFYPSLPFRQSLHQAKFIPNEVSAIDDLDELRAALRTLEINPH